MVVGRRAIVPRRSFVSDASWVWTLFLPIHCCLLLPNHCFRRSGFTSADSARATDLSTCASWLGTVSIRSPREMYRYLYGYTRNRSLSFRIPRSRHYKYSIGPTGHGKQIWLSRLQQCSLLPPRSEHMRSTPTFDYHYYPFTSLPLLPRLSQMYSSASQC